MWPRNLYSWIALTHDLLMATASLWLAHYLRLGERLMPFSGDVLPLATLSFVPLCLLVFVGSGLYRGLWRYASMQDLLTLTRAVTLAVTIFYLGLFLALRLEGVPRSVPVIHWLLLLAMLGGPRFAYRIIKDRRMGLDFTLAGIARVPVLLIGATDAAELFIRESRRNPAAPYIAVGLTDDDASRRGQQVHGVRIYGGSDQITKIVHKLERKGRKPQRVVLAEASPSGKRVRQLLAECRALGLPLSRLPQTLELKSGSPDKTEIRSIAVEDLLRRPQNVQDLRPVRKLVQNKTVLITGAGGSIGSEIARQVAEFAPASLLLLEHAEFQLYAIERELADRDHDYGLVPILGDVRDEVLLEKLFAQHRPQIVFHAAALKHVPLAEANPEATTSINVLGTHTVARAALKHKAEAMVLISTDKAVHPSSVMGASKRLAEKLMQSLGHDTRVRGGIYTEQGSVDGSGGLEVRPPSKEIAGHTCFMTVRFGNVLGSTGSVVPRFEQQLAAGGPLTVTHPEMTRYFMTIREAVELVLQSAALGVQLPEENGGIFVLDMGEPVKIDDLAKQMIHLAGLTQDRIEIRYTGLRPGEKMHEELFYAAEKPQSTPHHSIRLVACPGGALAELEKILEKLAKVCTKRDAEETMQVLREAVVEYQVNSK